ncbi:MAG: hypothetical protein ACHQNT_04585 [Bacteroidia bacterium]
MDLSLGEKYFDKMTEGELLENYGLITKYPYGNLTLKEVSAVYFKHFPILPQLAYTNPTNNDKQTFFRANRWSSLPLKIHLVSYPDPKRGIKVNRGRANFEDQPVLYGCTQSNAALKEINVKAGEIIIIGKWKMKLSQLQAGFLAINLKATEKRFTDLRDYIINAFSKRDSNIPDRKRKILLLIWSKLYLAKYYDISAFISWMGLYSPVRKWNYIVYPSVANELNTVNYAIHPEIINNNIAYPIMFEAIKINEINWPNIDARIFAVGFPYCEDIKWSTDMKDLKKFKL